MPSPADLLNLVVLRDGGGIQDQIYDGLRAAIEAGRLAPGARLPSSRSLAAQLGVARGTVDGAYRRLSGYGYVVGRGPGGTVVAAGAERKGVARRIDAAGPAEPGPPVISFHRGLPALDLFPRALWTRLLVRQARQLPPAGLAYPDPAGLPALRRAVAEYLQVARGVVCDPGQVVVTHGYQGALEIARRLVLRPQDAVWLEDPGYPFTRLALAEAKVRTVPVPVDEEGLRVDVGRRLASAARLAIVTPGHQSPTCVSLSPRRRRELLDWAEDAGAWILEDDYDSEFHYEGRRPLALKSLDARDRVLFAGSFSKTLFPNLRLGYLVVPARFVAAARTLCTLLGRGEADLAQAALAAFMAEGHFARHLRRMRSQYRARRQSLAEALEQQFGDRVGITRPQGGLHLIVRFAGAPPDVELARRAAAKGLLVEALSPHSIRPPAGDALLLGFANVAEGRAREAVRALAEAIA